jgi:hypothetical protein
VEGAAWAEKEAPADSFGNDKKGEGSCCWNSLDLAGACGEIAALHVEAGGALGTLFGAGYGGWRGHGDGVARDAS